MARDYYGLLGVSKGASDSEIKRAYRKLARELHPDVNPDEAAQAQFREISVAYEVLSDPEKRRIVDLGGDPMEGAGGGERLRRWLRRRVRRSRRRVRGVLRRRRRHAADRSAGCGPGSDSLLRMRLDLAECATGVTKHVTVDTAILCDVCQGKGTHGDSKPATCDTCHGHGEVQSVQRSLLGQVMTSRPCPVCAGVGEVIPDPCHRCGGDGRVRARREISVKIPPGVGDGMRVRLAAQGEVGPGGGPAGDLHVEVHEQPHDVFIRDGDDLHFSVSVPMVDAALGTTVNVDAILDGATEIAVAAGTQPGAVTTLRGHGMPNVRSGVRGNLHAHIDVVVPSRLDHQDAELLQKLKEHRVRDVAEVKSTQAAPAGGGLFSRLRETFTGR